MILIVKGKPSKTWCSKHERLHAGAKCPNCAEKGRKRRETHTEAVLRELAQSYSGIRKFA